MRHDFQPMKVKLSAELWANRIGESVAPATRWPVETWVIRETDGTPVRQVQLFKSAGKWDAWTGSIVHLKDKELARKLAKRRNAGRRR